MLKKREKCLSEGKNYERRVFNETEKMSAAMNDDYKTKKANSWFSLKIFLEKRRNRLRRHFVEF